MSIAFEEGQKVKAGDLLAEIDSRPFERQLAQAQGQLLRDQALLRNAQLDLERYRKLVGEGWVPRQKFDAQESLVQQYEGTTKANQAVVDAAALNIAYCRITAPISGRIGLRQVDQGNYVQANDTNAIVVITQTQPITVIFTLPEDQLPAVVKRLHSGAVMPVEVYDRSRSTKLATGRLMTVDNQIDTATGTVRLKAQFDNDDETLFPNQFVNVQLLVDVAHDVTVIPLAAIQRGAPGTFVYVVTPENTVKVRPVTLGQSEGERVAVSSGLAPGDRVVVDGADRLRDGAKINLSARESSSASTVVQHGRSSSATAVVGSSPGEGAKQKHEQDTEIKVTQLVSARPVVPATSTELVKQAAAAAPESQSEAPLSLQPSSEASDPPPAADRSPAASGKRLVVQLGSFQLEANAHRFTSQLKAKGIDVVIVHDRDRRGGDWYVVRTPDFASQEAAEAVAQSIRSAGEAQARVMWVSAVSAD
jgi:multidrug efflux system membrane fusion protein